MSAVLAEASCDYCGLPVVRSPVTAAGPVYCCFGCRFAAAVAQEHGETGRIRGTLTRLGLSIFFTMNVMVFTMALWSQDVFDAVETDPSASLLGQLFRFLGLLFSVPVLFLLGGPLCDDVLDHLRKRRLTTDALLLIGVLAAFAYSLMSVVRGEGHVYFEVTCVVLVAVTLGRWLEATGKHKTSAALQSLSRLLPPEVRVIRDGSERTVPLNSLNRGDCIRVVAGQRIPTDGRIIRQRAWIDEQVISGESQPVLKQAGDEVLGGSLNLDGDLLIEVEAPPQFGTLQRLADSVRAAAAVKGHYQRLADRLAAWFLPLMLCIAVGTCVAHWLRNGFEAALLSGLAVVLIACPCALGLATPLAVWAGLGRASQAQVLFRSGDALSRLASVRAVCFDKTGTLTTGSPVIDSFVCDNSVSEFDLLQIATELAAGSTHSLSAAIGRFANERLRAAGDDASRWLPEEIRTLPGLGLAGRMAGGLAGSPSRRSTVPTGVHALEFEDTWTWLGSPRLMSEQQLALPPEIHEQIEAANANGQPVVCLGWAGQVRGLFVFREELRPEAAPAIEQLKSAGFAVFILTGDQSSRASNVARQLDIESNAKLLPEEKFAAIREIRRRFGSVAMIGDGINDAPALAVADVGIAMGCGTDIARQTADVCLLGNDLLCLPWAIELSRATVRTIRVNLFWAFVYNVVGVGLAAMGWMNPIFAAAAMAVSSVLVVANSLRLTKWAEGKLQSALP